MSLGLNHTRESWLTLILMLHFLLKKFLLLKVEVDILREVLIFKYE